MERAHRCPDCGTSRWEWDPRHGGHRQAYEVKTWICPVCRVGESVMGDIQKEGSKGKKVRLEPTLHHPTLIPTPREKI